MNINLGSQWQTFVDERVQSGRYVSASEVVRDGLRLLQAQEAMQAARLDAVRAEVDRGIAALDRGEGRSLDPDGLSAYLDDVDRRGRERLAADPS